MRFVDSVILLMLFALLISGLYLLWQNLPTAPQQFQTYHVNIQSQLPLSSSQFYTNMRYINSRISYHISQNCSAEKQNDFERAISILEEKTILDFHPAPYPEISVVCANVAPTPTQRGHFVAGEGGATLIINATKYAIIKKGEIALYRDENCEQPQVALHELLHSLGFDHNSNTQSIMYPITNCAQTIDDSIIEEINALYQQPPLVDALIETVKANKTGPYLSFEIVITNEGLLPLTGAILELLVEGKKINSFEIEEIDVGVKRTLFVSNLRIPRGTERITFYLNVQEEEITKENNEADIQILNSS